MEQLWEQNTVYLGEDCLYARSADHYILRTMQKALLILGKVTDGCDVTIWLYIVVQAQAACGTIETKMENQSL